MRSLSFIAVIIALLAALAGAAEQQWQVERVPFHRVTIDDGFWKGRLETNREATIPQVLRQSEETGRIRNFARAAGLDDSEHEGAVFNDSDVYKLVEGMAYSFHRQPGNVMRSRLEEILSLVGRAQQEDGYLNTFYTLKKPDQRWTDLPMDHELYCAGHLMEAAVAHKQATGKQHFTRMARDFSDLIDRVFGPDARRDVPGHEEIELGLIRLWKTTGEQRYLDLARFFVKERGRANDRELQGTYSQDHAPLVEQEEAVGHCVRALYLYSAATELAAAGDETYLDPMKRLWKDVVHRKMYVTGGVGAHGHSEGFAEAYYLPNQKAYSETCASIAMVFWNDRMFRLLDRAKYADVFERVLYNGLLSGVSLDGRTFFYTNPLASRGEHHRQEFYGCACCPPNVARFMPRIGGYAYGTDGDGGRMTVAHYMNSSTTCELDGQQVKVTQRTRFPWEGDVKLSISPAEPAEFTLRLRIPDWARGELSSTPLYSYVEPGAPPVSVKVNGEQRDAEDLQDGFLKMRRTWEEGDTVSLHLPMPVKRVEASPKVEADRGRVALMRGPIVYCLEGCDNPGEVGRITLPPDAELEASFRPDLLGGVTVLEGTGRQLRLTEDDGGDLHWAERNVNITAIPYFGWDNREAAPMRVWLPRNREAMGLPENPPVTALATPSASHCRGGDTVKALNDGILPEESGDQSVPRMTWWPRKGGTEWVQYTFNEPRTFSAAEVYWFDDRGNGECRVPESWRLLWRDDGTWKPVDTDGEYTTRMDAFNEVSFKPVKTTALRLEADLRDDFSGGVLEWRLRAE